MCKQRVSQKNLEHSESESEEESGTHDEEGGQEEAQSERTPLLQPSSPDSPLVTPGAYSSITTTTTAQCLVFPVHCDSPVPGYGDYEEYHSPQEDTDSESDGPGEDRHPSDDDTAQLIRVRSDGCDNII